MKRLLLASVGLAAMVGATPATAQGIVESEQGSLEARLENAGPGFIMGAWRLLL